jgi:hypothetical protein
MGRVVKGKVKEVCKREGLLAAIEDGSEKGLMVRMKDHDFHCAQRHCGKTVYNLWDCNQNHDIG